MFRAALPTVLLALTLLSPGAPGAGPVRAPAAGTSPAGGADRSPPPCSQYTTYQTCNADPRCMWYGPNGPCGIKLE
jgi:hypothetical protein